MQPESSGGANEGKEAVQEQAEKPHSALLRTKMPCKISVIGPMVTEPAVEGGSARVEGKDPCCSEQGLEALCKVLVWKTAKHLTAVCSLPHSGVVSKVE